MLTLPGQCPVERVVSIFGWIGYKSMTNDWLLVCWRTISKKVRNYHMPWSYMTQGRNTYVHLVTLGAVDEVNLAYISHDLRARDVLHGKRVRTRLFHCERESIEPTGNDIESSRKN